MHKIIKKQIQLYSSYTDKVYVKYKWISYLVLILFPKFLTYM